MLKSTNSGLNWTAINTGLRNLSITALAIDPQVPTILYGGTTQDVFKSTNGGTTWNATNLGNFSIAALAIDPQTPTAVYVGTANGVFKSTDGGLPGVQAVRAWQI